MPDHRPAKPESEGNERHFPDQARFHAILPEEIEWRRFEGFPPEVRLAVLVGDPAEPGPYVIRVWAAHGAKLMPHRHPEDRIYTVISGIFYIGLGESFDETKLVAYPPGAVVVLPGGQAHFHSARSSDYISQVSAVGPLGLHYVDPAHDPRSHH